MGVELLRDSRGRFRRESPQERFDRNTENVHRAMIVELYIRAEEAKASFAHDARGLVRKKQVRDQDLANKILYNDALELSHEHDGLIAVGEANIFRLVPNPEKRIELRIQGLTATISWWERRLENQDLTVDDVMLGRRRITQLAEKVEKLNQSFQTPPTP